VLIKGRPAADVDRVIEHELPRVGSVDFKDRPTTGRRSNRAPRRGQLAARLNPNISVHLVENRLHLTRNDNAISLGGAGDLIDALPTVFVPAAHWLRPNQVSRP